MTWAQVQPCHQGAETTEEPPSGVGAVGRVRLGPVTTTEVFPEGDTEPRSAEPCAVPAAESAPLEVAVESFAVAPTIESRAVVAVLLEPTDLLLRADRLLSHFEELAELAATPADVMARTRTNRSGSYQHLGTAHGKSRAHYTSPPWLRRVTCIVASWRYIGTPWSEVEQDFHKTSNNLHTPVKMWATSELEDPE